MKGPRLSEGRHIGRKGLRLSKEVITGEVPINLGRPSKE